MDGNEIVFVDPEGREYRSVPAPTELSDDPVAALVAGNEAHGIEIDAKTNLSKWDGEPIDYIECIEAAARP